MCTFMGKSLVRLERRLGQGGLNFSQLVMENH